ncbi:hypothetical protein DQ384_24165 [Sphaerisporangium album]|uniref:Uncharacterized protein n=1 Tax=Sphaerisporangium album TaxID=509200 RepID=A0A367FF43_9ACTN|nr:hypothetical protein DQ384_24165 [Sphaerisporangium album]
MCGSLAGVVFGVASISKARNRAAFSSFVETVRRLPAVPPGWARRAALAAVAAEALLAVTSPLVLPRMLLGKTPYVPVLPVVWVLLAVPLLVAGGAAMLARAPRPRWPGWPACAATRRVLRKVALAAIASICVVSGIVTRPGDPDLAGGVLASLAGAAIASLFLHYDAIAEVFALNRVTHPPGEPK